MVVGTCYLLPLFWEQGMYLASITPKGRGKGMHTSYPPHRLRANFIINSTKQFYYFVGKFSTHLFLRTQKMIDFIVNFWSWKRLTLCKYASCNYKAPHRKQLPEKGSQWQKGNMFCFIIPTQPKRNTNKLAKEKDNS